MVEKLGPHVDLCVGDRREGPKKQIQVACRTYIDRFKLGPQITLVILDDSAIKIHEHLIITYCDTVRMMSVKLLGISGPFGGVGGRGG